MGIKLRKDARSSGAYWDPLSGAEKTLDTIYYPSGNRLRQLATLNPYGKRIVSICVKDAIGEAPEEIIEAVISRREQGVGVLIGNNGEDITLWGKPGRMSFYHPADVLQLSPMNPKLFAEKPQNFADKWMYFGHEVDASRLFFLCPDRRYDNWKGRSVLEAVMSPLIALDVLLKGCISRADVWGVNSPILKSAGGLTSKTQAEEIFDRFSVEKARIDSKDDIVFLGDRASQGSEIESILVNALSAGSGIPNMVLKGNQLGAVTGADRDMNQYELVLQGIRDEADYLMEKVGMPKINWRGFYAEGETGKVNGIDG